MVCAMLYCLGNFALSTGFVVRSFVCLFVFVSSIFSLCCCSGPFVIANINYSFFLLSFALSFNHEKNAIYIILIRSIARIVSVISNIIGLFAVVEFWSKNDEKKCKHIDFGVLFCCLFVCCCFHLTVNRTRLRFDSITYLSRKNFIHTLIWISVFCFFWTKPKKKWMINRQFWQDSRNHAVHRTRQMKNERIESLFSHSLCFGENKKSERNKNQHKTNKKKRNKTQQNIQ